MDRRGTGVCLALGVLWSACAPSSGSQPEVPDEPAQARHGRAGSNAFDALQQNAAQPDGFTPDSKWVSAATRRTLVPDIPEAENLFFTPDGRLFVSGGENVFEIKRAVDGAWSKSDLFDENCLVEGITHSNGYLYGVCSMTDLDTFGDAYLLAGELTAEPHMKIIGRLDDLGIPNGMNTDSQGNLYTTYSGNGTIAKLVLSAPLELDRVEVWSKEDLPFANGLRFIDGYAYFTTLDDWLTGHFGRIPVLPDGSAGKAEHLFERDLTVLDDLGTFGDDLVIAGFSAGNLLFYRDGKIVAETAESVFESPTSVAQGRPPMFREDQLLVTEKGLFGVRGETDGDRLSVFELPQ